MIIPKIEHFISKLIPNKAIIGVDYGEKRMGVAITDKERIIALPHKLILRRDFDTDAAELLSIMQKYDTNCIVFGLPLDFANRATPLTNSLLDFLNKFNEYRILDNYEYIIGLIDERYTSKQAERMLRDIPSVKRKTRDSSANDQLAASLILQAVLDMERQTNGNIS